MDKQDVIDFLRELPLDERNELISHVNINIDALPTSWEEFCENYPIRNGEVGFDGYCSNTVIYNRCERDSKDDVMVLPNAEYAEAIMALCKLIQLRDCYRCGWKPDFDDVTGSKFAIYTSENELTKVEFFTINAVISFQTREIRDAFFDNFKDLLETAKILL